MKSTIDSADCSLLQLELNRSVMIEGLGVKRDLRVSFRFGKDLEIGRFGVSKLFTIPYVFQPIQVSRTAAFFASAISLAIKQSSILLR